MRQKQKQKSQQVNLKGSEWKVTIKIKATVNETEDKHKGEN